MTLETRALKEGATASYKGRAGPLERSGIDSAICRRPGISTLERKLRKWTVQDLFFDSKNYEAARRLVEKTLCHAYLFGRVTIPSYAQHIFSSLKYLPPLDSVSGVIVRENLELVIGELCTNNIFLKKGVCHAHYQDMKNAALQAGIDPGLVEEFERDERKRGFGYVIGRNYLWSFKMGDYALKLRELTDDPLTTFMIVACSEHAIQEGYLVILDNLHPDPCFDAFRHFMKRHIELDTQEHGPSTVRWLNYYLRMCKPDDADIQKAIRNTIAFVDSRIATYG